MKTMDRVGSDFLNGCKPIDEFIESYTPGNESRFGKYVDLIKAGRLGESWYAYESARKGRDGFAEADVTTDYPTILSGNINLRVREAFITMKQNWKNVFPGQTFTNYRPYPITM